MVENNLLFNGDTPFTPPNSSVVSDPDHLFDDINSGTVYYDAWLKHCPPGSRKVLLPLIFFIDKTFLDKKGKLNSEPITFTLGIFKRFVRNNNPHAWRSIGMVADAFMSGYFESIDKAKDYHSMLSHLFAELQQVQDTPGITWDIEFKGTHRVVFVPLIHMIITDTKAADDMVGKIQYRGTTVETIPARLCRFCDTPGALCDSPDEPYTLTNSDYIESLFRNNEHEAIKAISYRPLENAFWSLKLSDPHGINGCMPPDTLHVMLKGTHMYIRECFFDLLRLESTERSTQIREQVQMEAQQSNRRKRSRGNTGAARSRASLGSRVPPVLTDKQLAKIKIFTPTSKPPFEAIAFALASQLKRQSDRDLPRTHFAQGITQNFAKLTGSEETGVLLLILISLTSTAGSTMFASPNNVATHMGVLRFSNWIGTIERILQLEQWVKDVTGTSGHTRRDLEVIDAYIPLVLQRLKNTVERRQGLKTKLIKIHLLRHLVESHIKYGRLENCNTASGETRHKHFVKNAGKQTQKRKSTFDQEVSRRNVESVIINSGIPQTFRRSVVPNSARKRNVTEGYLYKITKDTVARHPLSSSNIRIQDLERGVRDSLSNIQNAIRNATPSEIPIVVTVYHTYFCSQGIIYRACPQYMGAPWYDWARLNTTDSDPHGITARLLCFFQVNTNNPTMFVGTTRLFRSKTYFTYTSLDGRERVDKTHAESVMLFSSKLLQTIRCASTEHICGTAIVYQDVDFRDHRRFKDLYRTEYYGVILPRKQWSDLFLHRAETDERASARRQTNNS
jgi:hypothetical protein